MIRHFFLVLDLHQLLLASLCWRTLSPITRSLTLSNLPTGTYTVNAPSKTISNVYYQASARTQSAVVNVGTTATITVTYSVAVLPLIPIIDFVLD